MATPHGPPVVIDIYHGDPVIDFRLTAKSGIIGVIHKASQGLHIVDERYATRRKGAGVAKLMWGAYHFMSLNEDGRAQADRFLSVAAPDPTTLLALDWESPNPKGGASPTVAQVKAFCERIHEVLGRYPKLYSGNVAKEKAGNDIWFTQLDLWLCQYGPTAVVPTAWKRKGAWLWQNNGDSFGPGPHHIPGISGLCDNNCLIAPMTVEKLKATWTA